MKSTRDPSPCRLPLISPLPGALHEDFQQAGVRVFQGQGCPNAGPSPVVCKLRGGVKWEGCAPLPHTLPPPQKKTPTWFSFTYNNQNPRPGRKVPVACWPEMTRTEPENCGFKGQGPASGHWKVCRFPPQWTHPELQQNRLTLRPKGAKATSGVDFRYPQDLGHLSESYHPLPGHLYIPGPRPKLSGIRIWGSRLRAAQLAVLG